MKKNISFGRTMIAGIGAALVGKTCVGMKQGLTAVAEYVMLVLRH